MTWEPTHVQFTVLRARKLVGKAKGSKAAKVSDVFVTIQLGKEKFQTSTIKYGSSTTGVVEWFEECDLMIPNMEAEVDMMVMNRGLLSDEFIGYASVPLNQYSVYDRPRAEWFQLKQKPSKEPDGRYRGEVEARLTFHVKSKSEQAAISGLKTKAPSLKSLVSAVGKVGDKFKLTRSKSFRGEGRQTFSQNSSSPYSDKSNKQSVSTYKTVADDISRDSNDTVHFPAVDLYAPDWNSDFDIESLDGVGNFSRSYSLITERRRRERDFKSQSMYNLPSEKSMTLPSRSRRPRVSLDESLLVLANHRASVKHTPGRASVTSQEGYLENMFQRECAVYNDMAEEFEESIEDEPENEPQHRRTARAFNEDIEEKGSNESLTSTSSSYSGISRSESESETEMRLRRTVVRRKAQEKKENVTPVEQYNADDEKHESPEEEDNSSENEEENHKKVNNQSSNKFPEYKARAQEQNGRLNSQGSSDNATSSRGSSVKSSYSHDGKYHSHGSSESLGKSKRVISPDTDFSFTGVSQASGGYDLPSKRKSRQYAKGGRRYTVEGVEGSVRRSAPDIRTLKSYSSKDESLPDDLMAVYKNMNREELIRLVVTHKAQLIRKDQYIRDLERYIDDLLVRVMEATPRLLQTL